jgi:hypothetical protein
MASLGPISDDGRQAKQVRRATAELVATDATSSQHIAEAHDNALIAPLRGTSPAPATPPAPTRPLRLSSQPKTRDWSPRFLPRLLSGVITTQPDGAVRSAAPRQGTSPPTRFPANMWSRGATMRHSSISADFRNVACQLRLPAKPRSWRRSCRDVGTDDRVERFIVTLGERTMRYHLDHRPNRPGIAAGKLLRSRRPRPRPRRHRRPGDRSSTWHAGRRLHLQ